jgi:hypothetical protein
MEPMGGSRSGPDEVPPHVKRRRLISYADLDAPATTESKSASLKILLHLLCLLTYRTVLVQVP